MLRVIDRAFSSSAAYGTSNIGKRIYIYGDVTGAGS